MGVVSSLGLTCTIDMVELVVDNERDSVELLCCVQSRLFLLDSVSQVTLATVAVC